MIVFASHAVAALGKPAASVSVGSVTGNWIPMPVALHGSSASVAILSSKVEKRLRRVVIWGGVADDDVIALRLCSRGLGSCITKGGMQQPWDGCCAKGCSGAGAFQLLRCRDDGR